MQDDLKFLAAGVKHIEQSRDVKSTIAELVRLAASACGSEMGSLYILNRNDGKLRPFVLVNLPPEYTAGCEEVALGTQCCGRAALHKMPWIVADMWTDPLFVDCREASMRAGIRSGYSVPVLDSTDNCLGTLACHFRHAHTPSVYAIERNRLFAQLIAFALARFDSNSAHAAA